MRLPLRPYQREAVEAVRRARAAGHTRLLVVAPTGSGKTYVLAQLVADALAAGERVLLLVHRQELVDQLAERIRRAIPDAWLGIEQAARRADPLSRVIVGSVPTLAARGGRRLDRLGRFGLVLLDEAHHAVAATFQALLRRLGCFTPGGPALVGATATSMRGDGVGLGHIFQSIAHETPLPALMADGTLCPLRAYTIDTGVALDHVRQRGGEFVEEELAHAVNTPARNALAVRAYQAHAAGRRAVAYAVDRQHVHDLARQFQLAGIPAAPLTGDLPRALRADRLAAFRQGALQVLVNCEILTEGIDLPEIACLVGCRPTASILLLTQIVGRCLRPHPGKTDAIYLDLVDTTRTHRLQTLATLAGLPPKVRFRGERLFDVAPRIERVLTATPWLAAAIDADRLVTVDDILRASQPVDLLYLDLPLPAAFQRSRLAWVAVPPVRWVLPAPDGTLTVRQTLLAYEVAWRARGAAAPEPLGAADTLEEAVALAEQAARTRLAPGSRRMLDRRAPWRQRPLPSRRRARAAARQRLHVPGPGAPRADTLPGPGPPGPGAGPPGRVARATGSGRRGRLSPDHARRRHAGGPRLAPSAPTPWRPAL